MTTPRLLEDIRNQPASLERVLDYQLSEGRAALAEAAGAIEQADRVVLAGMGSSLFACVPLQYLLASRGVACEVIEAAELVHYRHAAAKGAAVILVSRSGESVEIGKALPVIADRAAAIIGVTNEPDSTLGKHPRHSVFVNSLTDEMVAVQTYTGTMLVLLLLGYMASGKPEREWIGQIRAALQALAGALKRFEAESETWRRFLEDARFMYLLARGPSRGSALEGALLFNEVAKTPSTAMGAGDFRHGPVEIVAEDFRCILFAPEGATRALNIALARDLRSFGGQVRVVGPADAGADGLFWETPAVPEELAPLVEIAPVQFAALRTAEWHGIMPGRFRYVSQVTVSESSFKRPVS
jgi:glutamine---fructose-6-phosphate transaminase (isomerizing)